MDDRKNRLAQESSPYLLQHQHNPVDWYPWGEEAFETARRENKPIFLSVGYSTCYWCHVMERQSFEIEATANEMNARFVNIKVDREERPDVDQLYMTAVQVLTRQGGWPMSVFLTPDLRPFYGGTYFPPVDSYGRPGFVTLLKGIEDAYRNRPADVEKSAGQLVNILSQLAEPSRPEQPLRLDDAFISALIDRSVGDYDSRNGGFGGAPKFPRETLLELLLVHQRHHPDPARMKMLTHTLDALECGGIRDHLGGGFHRYSTDAHWLVPHFEIMLYDNAMLAWVYTEAFVQTGEIRYASVARGILDFTLREMTDSSGAFYTAFDAEVDAKEGLSYLWTADEIESILGAENAKLFNAVYGVDQGPNFADPHHGNGQPDKSILYLPRPLEVAAKSAGFTVEQLESRLAPMRQSLYQARLKRKQPLLDTKILTSWNALMIRAMAYAGKVLGEPRYTDAASKAADFLLAHHRTSDGGLYRTSRDGRAKYDAFLDDYAFLAQALLEIGRRNDAQTLCGEMLKRFGDNRPTGGGFYFTQAGARDLIIRQKTATDFPLPSGNGVAAMVLLELGQAPAARATLEAFAEQIDNNGEGMSSLVQAALQYIRAHGPIDVAPGAPSPTDRPMSPQQLAHSVVSLGAAMASPTEMHVQVNILKGFHINSHEAAPGLIATQLVVNGIDVESIDYPAGVKRKFDFAPESLHVYEGQVVIVLHLKHEPQGAFQLSLSYQPCDESSCLAPLTKTVEIAVT